MTDMNKRPNIVLICVDQWRGDCLSIDGHPVVETPYLDSLVRHGVRFGSAYSSCPSCIPARAGLLTGLGQRRHGRVGYRDGVPWRYDCTMPGELTAAGYQTQAIGKLHVYPERWQAGFQNVILHDGFLTYARKRSGELAEVDDYLPWLRAQPGQSAATDYFDHGVNCNSFVARPWDKEERLHPSNWVVHQGIDFLRRRDPSKPFFLNLSFHRPHPPLDPPGWALDQYLARDMPPVPVGDWHARFADRSDPHAADPLVGPISEARLHRARAGYYGLMTHIDHQINRFVEAVHEAGLGDDTCFCFVSDHGELLGDHHLFRKGLPYEGSARVPLLFWGAGLGAVDQGARRGEIVELRDLMPTLLELAGAELPTGLDGRSLVPLLRGEGEAVRPYLHGEHVIMEASVQWIRDERWKYIWHSGEGWEQLFDLRDDPDERHDLAADQGDETARMRQLLIAELDSSPEGYVQNGRLCHGRQPMPVLPGSPADVEA